MMLIAASVWAETSSPEASATLPVVSCQDCHDGRKPIEVLNTAWDADPGAKRTLTPIQPERYAAGVHGRMACVDCHVGISQLDPPHPKGRSLRVDCAACHQRLAQEHPESAGMAEVERNIEAYGRSFHARPNRDQPELRNATCHQCHDSHFFNIPRKNTPELVQWRREIHKLCGACHEDQVEKYAASVHGRALLEKGDVGSATCTDCHSNHDISGAFLTSFKLVMPDTCGKCHPRNLVSYRDTYHGQVSRLGYAHTAKCYDCHESHKTLPVKDPGATVHPDNRLKTCRKCHDGEKRPQATAGFASFSPHAHGNDFERYPQMWIAARFMGGLLWSVFAFFWLHSGLWYYREWRERRENGPAPRVDVRALGLEANAHVRRFSVGWRVAHLVFAVVVMTLVLTGMTLLNAHAPWAPLVAQGLGGAESLGRIHRICATLLMGIFLFHLVYVMQRLVRDRAFRWFGPDSLLPNWKDVADCRDMFRWFLGQGPKPAFDRWTYYEKFDYWAVFWGMAVIGGSGLLLAFPHMSAQYLEGWVFNVALLVHGEEAFLAAVFLFTVHFFNNHFRPDKLPPPDIVMFTGTQPLEEFRRDHPAHYRRLMADGTLKKFLVTAPSSAFVSGARILGLALIGLGLILLVLVVQGYVGG